MPAAQTIVSMAVLAAATVALAARVEPLPTWYYHVAWWSYIVAVDGENRRLSGRSLLRDRPRHFLMLAAVSVVWWTLFEAINLRMGNWYYVMSLPERPLRWVAGILAFATVLPAVFETLELFEHRGWLRHVAVRPLVWTRGKERVATAIGVAMLALPLLWPELFYPLVWGSFVFLLEPWNRAHARNSFLRDLERGEAGPFCRTLAAGAVCGFLWEVWNFWARTKWMYTVPMFEESKIFEMPVLGFLGFPPFAVECVVLVRYLERFGRSLEVAEPAPSPPVLRSVTTGLVGLGLLVIVFAVVDEVTVDSFYRPVAEMRVLPGPVRERLSAAGLLRPEDVVRALGAAEERRAWAARTGLPERDLAAAYEEVRLVMHHGLGDDRAHELEALGVHSLADLARWDAPALAEALEQKGARPRGFIERRARLWLKGLPGRS